MRDFLTGRSKDRKAEKSQQLNLGFALLPAVGCVRRQRCRIRSRTLGDARFSYRKIERSEGREKPATEFGVRATARGRVRPPSTASHPFAHAGRCEIFLQEDRKIGRPRKASN